MATYFTIERCYKIALKAPAEKLKKVLLVLIYHEQTADVKTDLFPRPLDWHQISLKQVIFLILMAF